MTIKSVLKCKDSLEGLLKGTCPDNLDKTITTILIRLAVIAVFESDYRPIEHWATFQERAINLWNLTKSPLFDVNCPLVDNLTGENSADAVLRKVSDILFGIIEKSEHKIWEIGSIYEGLISSKDRRKSGSHYTPVKLAREVVEEAFRPWLERHNYNPSVKDVLDLKVCDPAVGAGVFLIETADFLDNLIKGKIEGSKRAIIENCLYGVDINWFPVEITKLCLWLKANDPHFSVEPLGNKIVQGDSLVGGIPKGY